MEAPVRPHLCALLAAACSEYGLNDDKEGPPGPPQDTARDDSGDPPEDPLDSQDPETSDVPTGRVLTVLLTLSDDWVDQDLSRSLLLNAVAWAAPQDEPDPGVLVIRDDGHNDEDAEDSENIWRWLVDAGYRADFLEEPADGATLADLTSYHVAILSNPGHSPDDLSTVQALYGFSCAGLGVIFQGDDMAHFEDEDAFSMESLTRLAYQDNGTSYHGYDVDNDEGSAYEVRLVDNASPIVEGIGGQSFRYGNDIDTTEVASAEANVLAWATVEDTSLPLKPTIAAWSP
jgi:hypothetical protein